MSIFSDVPLKSPQKSLFQLDNDNKLSLEMGYIVPVKVFEVLPGDEVTLDVEAFVRLAALAAPVMQDFNIIVEAFFEPWRLLMPPEYWDRFQDPEENLSLPVMSVHEHPAMNGLVDVGTLWDYLGFPTRPNLDGFQSTGDDSLFLSLPFKGYQHIYNEWYRDPNVTDEVPLFLDEIKMTDPVKVGEMMKIRKRCYRKDYFTSALPDAQRGSDINIPASGDVTIGFNKNVGPTQIYGRPGMNYGSAPFVVAQQTGVDDAGRPVGDVVVPQVDSQEEVSPQGVEIDNSHSLFGKLLGTNTPLESLRRAMTVQGLLELFERTGGRLKERFLALWGTAPADLRIRRPELLGQAVSPLVIGEVLQTSSSNAAAAEGEYTTPQGNMAGHGAGLNSGHLFTKTFDENGYIYVMLSIVPRASYFQGMPRKFSRRSYFDLANPMLAHLGEQSIKQGELMWQAPSEEMTQEGDYDNDADFGYQSRYAEYKFEPNEVHGEFRSSLSFWHGARIFDPLYPPKLNADFLEVSTPEQIFAVQDDGNQRIYAQVAFHMQARRCLPYYGVPQFPHL